MSEIEYTQHESDEGLKRVDSMALMGLSVMVGRWEDGTAEIKMWSTCPYDPVDARLAVKDGLLPSA